MREGLSDQWMPGVTRYAENWGVQHEEMIFGTRSSMERGKIA